MSHEVKAVYENGVFRPLEPVSLDEHQEVRVRIPEPEHKAESTEEEEEPEPEPVWRGVFPGKREHQPLFVKEIDVSEGRLPQRPFSISVEPNQVDDE